MQQLPPIYVISLPGSKRRAQVEQRLARHGLAFSFWDATHGATLSDAELAKIDTAFTEREWGHGLNAGEIGCALSHIRLYEHLVAEGVDEAIVLEDDAVPAEGLRRILEAIRERLPQRAELTFLHHGKAKSWPLKRPLPHGHRLVRYRYPSSTSKRCIISARGYWLTLAGARKLLEQAYPVRMPADYLTGYIQCSGVHAYGIEPNVLVDTDMASEIDTISQRTYGTHAEASGAWR